MVLLIKLLLQVSESDLQRQLNITSVILNKHNSQVRVHRTHGHFYAKDIFKCC